MERARLLTERLDALVVESRSLGYSVEQVVRLLQERDGALRAEIARRGELPTPVLSERESNGQEEDTHHENS
jgi:hypothetical protein